MSEQDWSNIAHYLAGTSREKMFDRLRAADAEKDRLVQKLMDVAHRYQEHTGQTIDDMLAGKWTHPSGNEQAAEILRLRDALIECHQYLTDELPMSDSYVANKVFYQRVCEALKPDGERG